MSRITEDAEAGRNVANGHVICHECGDKHIAEYSHEGQWNQGHIFAVVCGDFTDYYTTEALI